MVGPGSRVFGKYEVIRRIAVGGMGEIFLARQTGVVDRLVILKSLLPQLASDAQALAQFLDEARILGSINHPNVCALYDVGEWEALYFIAMEYINGVDLSHILRFCEENKKRLPPLTSAAMVREAALGLDAAHIATDATGQPLRVVHRDISPHNIMVRQDGLAKVVDFGVAVAENRMQKTEVGLLKGKLGYMPPEQIKGSPVDPKADQFSLGIVLWELLTQRRLFTGENAAQVFMKTLKEQVPAPSSLVPDVPKELDAIVGRMTAQEPVDRFPRLGDAAMAIRRALDQYKSPDNAATLLIKATVGSELTARLKDLAQAPRPEMPQRPAPGATPSSPAAVIPGQSSGPGTFCGSCGNQTQIGDRFCRVCGATIGTGTNPAGRTPAPPSGGGGGTGTAVVPRVDVMSPGSSNSGPAIAAPVPTAEGAVVAGLVEVLEAGQVTGPSDDARAAAFRIVDQLAMRAGAVAEKRPDGRFAITLSGDGAIAKAVEIARGSVRAAARAGHSVLLRVAVAVEEQGTAPQLQALKGTGEVLVDNCAPGSAIIVDAARNKGDNPPTTRSATIKLRDGSSLLAHELDLPRRLLGRTDEVAQLDVLLEAVERDGRAQQLMFLGEGGVGKTALLEVGMAFAHDRGFVVGLARGARVAEPLALDVLRQLTRSLCLDLLARERVSGEWSRILDVCGLPATVAQRLKALIDDDGDGGLRDIPPVRRRAVVKAAVLSLFEVISARAPVALFVDDLHKGDVQSFELLSELGARLGDKRLALIAAGRPQQGERVLPLAKRAPLGPLTTRDVVALAGLLLGSPVVDPLAGLIVTRANGSPLILTLVLRFMHAARMLGQTPQGVQLTVAPERAIVPQNVTGLVHAHHGTLPPEAQTLLLAAAHVGQVFLTSELFRVTEGVKDVVAVLKGLAEVGIIESVGAERWAFSSSLELETIPGRLDAMQGRQLQQRVADALQKDAQGRFTLELGERLVVHLQAAGAAQRAAEISLLVADRAIGLGLFELAATHYRRALAQDWRALSAAPGNEERAIRVLKDAAAATTALIEFDAGAAIDVAAPVLKGVPPLLAIHARVEVLRQRALAFARAKRFSEAEGCLDEALETLQGQYDDALAAGLLIDLAVTLEQRGDVDSALAQLQEALRRLGSAPVGARERAYDGLLLLGRLGLRQRQFEPARQAFGAAIEEARRANRAVGEADARAMLAGLNQAQGNLEAAVAETETAITLAEQVADPVLEARLHQQRGRALVALGRRGDAATAIAKALECAKRGQWDEGVSAAQQLLAVVGA